MVNSNGEFAINKTSPSTGYDLDVNGASDEPYVKKAFARKYDADKYCRELSLKWQSGKSYVEAITLERPPNLD